MLPSDTSSSTPQIRSAWPRSGATIRLGSVPTINRYSCDICPSSSFDFGPRVFVIGRAAHGRNIFRYQYMSSR